MMAGNGQLSVPPGFRFHPTDEELLYYYLRKKVSYEAIDLDVIREVDLNKLEPWDLKDKCRIGSGPQNEWYFFSHKDKKYPTGTRTNRATMAGFWKATGRDKAIHLSNSKRIGMRKTLVFYTGRAPHGQKTDWIMHEYRLDEDNSDIQEDGWVVCRVFKKKNHNNNNRCFQSEVDHQEDHHHLSNNNSNYMKGIASSDHHHHLEPHKQTHLQTLYHHQHDYNSTNFDGSMHLPQLFSPESFNVTPISLNNVDLECSQNLLRLTSTAGGGGGSGGGGGINVNVMQHERSLNGDWSFLDKLLASHHHSSSQLQLHDHSSLNKCNVPSSHQFLDPTNSTQKFPFHYLGCDTHDILKFSK